VANIISVSEASSDDETWVWNPLTCRNERFYWPLSAKSWIHDAGTKLVFAPDETDQDENHAESSPKSQIPTSQTPVKSHSKDKKPQLLSQEPEIPDEWLHFSNDDESENTNASRRGSFDSGRMGRKAKVEK
jgi:hypothetical protein